MDHCNEEFMRESGLRLLSIIIFPLIFPYLSFGINEDSFYINDRAFVGTLIIISWYGMTQLLLEYFLEPWFLVCEVSFPPYNIFGILAYVAAAVLVILIAVTLFRKKWNMFDIFHSVHFALGCIFWVLVLAEFNLERLKEYTGGQDMEKYCYYQAWTDKFAFLTVFAAGQFFSAYIRLGMYLDLRFEFLLTIRHEFNQILGVFQRARRSVNQSFNNWANANGSRTPYDDVMGRCSASSNESKAAGSVPSQLDVRKPLLFQPKTSRQYSPDAEMPLPPIVQKDDPTTNPKPKEEQLLTKTEASSSKKDEKLSAILPNIPEDAENENSEGKVKRSHRSTRTPSEESLSSPGTKKIRRQESASSSSTPEDDLKISKSNPLV